MNIPSKLLQLAQTHGDREAIQEGPRCLRYGELTAASIFVGKQIEQATDAQNVALFLPNGIGFSAGFFAITMTGRTAVPLNFLLKPAEIARIISNSQVDTVITAEPLEKALSGTGLRILHIEDMLKDAKPLPFQPPEIARDDVAAILYTSGTTDEPMGVMQSHGNIIANIEAGLRAMSVEDDDVFLSVLPLFHTFGLTCTFLLPILNGIKTVMMPRFIPGAIAETIARRKISIIIAVPSMFRPLLKAFEETGGAAESLRLCIAGGEKLPPALCEKFEEVAGVPLLEGYGMTETSPVISLNRLDARRAGTVGITLDNWEVRVLDPGGKPVPAGEDGEICVRGESVMKGYWRRPDETRLTVDAEGLLHTGDMGRIDKDGFLSITGRLKELIISAGKNINPGEIEEVLEKHPAVSEAAVIGVPDDTRGEVPRAFVVLNDGANSTFEEIIAHCREFLAEYKRPRAIEFMDALPRSLTGKVLKRLLAKIKTAEKPE